MGITFNEKIEGWRKWIGLTCTILYCFALHCICYSLFPLLPEAIGKVVSVTVGFIWNFTEYIAIPIVFAGIIFKPLKQQSAKKIIVWSFIGFLMVFVSNVIFHGFIDNKLIELFGFEKFGSANSQGLEEKLINSNTLETIWFAFNLMILGPFIEEVLYRVCLFTTIRKKNKILSHLITALLFGFQHVFVAMFFGNHLQEILLIGSYVCFSLILTIMYEKLRTPVPGMIAHMLLNSFFTVPTLISVFTS